MRVPFARRLILTVERLEDRTVPAGVPFHFTLDDPTNAFAAYPLLRSNLEAAGRIIGEILDGKGSLEVRVRATTDVDRAGGTALAVVYVGYQNGGHVYDPGTVSEARTGVDPNGAVPDLELMLNTRDYLPLCWFDPSGAARTATLPADRIDFISVAVHETLHALGYQGYRTVNGAGQGTFPSVYRTRYDSLTGFGIGGDASLLYFSGVNAVSLYGGPVPLTTWPSSHPVSDENFYHVGNGPGRPGAELLGDMMNGVEFRQGRRYQITNLDLVMLADLGWSLTDQAPAEVRSLIARNRQPPPLPPPAPMPQPPLAGDVSAWVRVVVGRWKYNRRNRQYERSVLLVNEAGAAVHGPLLLVFEVIDRTVRNRRRIGRLPFRVAPDGLAVGQRVTVNLTTVNPNWAASVVSVRIVAGVGREVGSLL